MPSLSRTPAAPHEPTGTEASRLSCDRPIPESATGARTLGELVLGAASRGDSVAMRSPSGSGTATVTYGALVERARLIARGLIALGIKPGDRVSILGSTRAEWTLCDLGAVCAAAVVAPIYDTNSPSECAHVLRHSQARLVFCQDAAQVAKVAVIRDSCPDLEHVVVMDGGDAPGSIALSELIGNAGSVAASEVDDRISAVAAEDLATIVYTSGTTGPAKGCMLTHANFLAATRMLRGELLLDDVQPVVYMFLPLAHALARVTQAVVLDAGGTIAYWAGDPAQIAKELATVAPTHFPAVPRIYEKIHTAAVDGVHAQMPRFGGRLLRWALAQGKRTRAAARAGRPLGPLDRARYRLADRLVLAKVRAVFGDRLVMAIVGAAPIAAELIDFFDACGVLLLEGYGMTETCSTATLNPASAPRAGTVGCAVPESEVRIAPDGEIMLRGPHVFAGYFHDHEATAAAIDEDGWLRSGDLGSLTADGYLKLTGRKKDLIITSSGKNITPANIECALRDTRWISEAVVYGDDRPYLVAMVTLDRDEVAKLGGRLRISPDLATMALDRRVRAEVQTDVDAVNTRFARIEQIKRFAILDRDLTEDGGELTPTLKVKRNVVYRKYAGFFADIYAGV
ncbi:MAG: long-chain fatty acid--CoA ligase [Solirubrobacteraceae bacterium]|jgi:long-chain acyl-CoA synthetase